MDYIEQQASKGELPRCFNCREPINARDVFEVIKHDDDDEEHESDLLNAAIEDEDDLYTSTQSRAATENK
ncbi:UNVERIFIED_CONTAM: hypothetical protein NY603_33525, partial [Bacteroidetes bacterium 56_B9]